MSASDQCTLIRLGQSQSRILVAAVHWYNQSEGNFLPAVGAQPLGAGRHLAPHRLRRVSPGSAQPPRGARSIQPKLLEDVDVQVVPHLVPEALAARHAVEEALLLLQGEERVVDRLHTDRPRDWPSDWPRHRLTVRSALGPRPSSACRLCCDGLRGCCAWGLSGIVRHLGEYPGAPRGASRTPGRVPVMSLSRGGVRPTRQAGGGAPREPRARRSFGELCGGSPAVLQAQHGARTVERGGAGRVAAASGELGGQWGAGRRSPVTGHRRPSPRTT